MTNNLSTVCEKNISVLTWSFRAAREISVASSVFHSQGDFSFRRNDIVSRFLIGCFCLLLGSCSCLSLQSQADTSTNHLSEVNPSSALNLHVPSPDWEDQIIYFLMIDRFNDGDSNNNDQGYEEYDPTDSRKFSGGDLKGVIEQLDYIQNLGATAVWITPPVANQWWDPLVNYGGYHGYWTEHFKEVDAHFGDLEQYQLLSHHLHEREMYLIQDIVLNHTGNFFGYKGGYNPDSLEQFLQFNEGSTPVTKPSQFPFNLNDVRNPEHRKAGIYHWTTYVTDYNDPQQKLLYQMGDLDDLNTENIVVREVLRDAYGYWIRMVGVDGFRIDTIVYVELDFWNDFMNAISKEYPGMNKVAAATGRENFLTFGEAFVGSDPYEDSGEKTVASYLGTKEKPALNGMLNFPLYYTINRVFAQGQPTRYMTYRLNKMMEDSIYKNPYLLPTFIDNHDVSRFLSNATTEGMLQALFLQFTIPGIPVVYQGTEQQLEEVRPAMFATGWGSEGKDHFDQSTESYAFVQGLANMRKDNKIFTRGELTILQDSENGAGVLAFSRKYQGKEAIVVFNTSDERILMGNLETDLSEGTQLNLLQGMKLKESVIVGPNGRLTMELPSRAVGVFEIGGQKELTEKKNLKVDFRTRINNQIFEEDILLKGRINRFNEECFLVIDGKLDSAVPIQTNKKGKWSATIPAKRFPFGTTNHDLLVYDIKQQIASASIPFKTEIAIQGKRTTTIDPSHDDNGLANNYTKPTHESYIGQMDILKVETLSFGASLQLELTMRDLTSVWSPPNGFDHTLVHVFIDLPNQSGSDYLSMLNTQAPEGFEWNYTANIAGWQTAYYSSEGESLERGNQENDGTKLSYTPKIEVDEANKKIKLQFTPDMLGNPSSLEGAKIYITTWDSGGGDGGYRAIHKEADGFNFGGDGGPKPSLILDASEVIVIPQNKK